MPSARRYVTVLYASGDAQVWDFWLFSGYDLEPFVKDLEADLKREPFFARSVPPAARAFARECQEKYGFQLSRSTVGRHVPQLKIMWEDAQPPV